MAALAGAKVALAENGGWAAPASFAAAFQEAVVYAASFPRTSWMPPAMVGISASLLRLADADRQQGQGDRAAGRHYTTNVEKAGVTIYQDRAVFEDRTLCCCSIPASASRRKRF